MIKRSLCLGLALGLLTSTGLQPAQGNSWETTKNVGLAIATVMAIKGCMDLGKATEKKCKNVQDTVASGLEKAFNYTTPACYTALGALVTKYGLAYYMEPGYTQTAAKYTGYALLMRYFYGSYIGEHISDETRTKISKFLAESRKKSWAGICTGTAWSWNTTNQATSWAGNFIDRGIDAAVNRVYDAANAIALKAQNLAATIRSYFP